MLMSQKTEQILETWDLVLLVALLLCTSVKNYTHAKLTATEHKKLCFSIIKLLEILG